MIESCIAVAAACDKLEEQVEPFRTASVGVEGDTPKLDEYLSGKSEVVVECRRVHGQCFDPHDLSPAEAPASPFLSMGHLGVSRRLVCLRTLRL